MSIVEVTRGALRGVTEEGLHVFRGVPYAAPPVGALRWRAAQSHPGWSGVRDATTSGPSAPQPYAPVVHPILGDHGRPPFGEDCLTLNVWTPGIDDKRRPVLVWIHGGGFLTGSGSLPVYAGDTFARNGDLVVVSISYRLGPLGYLHGAGDANVWLSDQLAALRWIREHIALFGGDPAGITVAGQSGGAFSTAALTDHGDLFQRAVLQSPPLGVPLPTPEEALDRTSALLDAVRVADVEALRAVPWERLIEGTVSVVQRFRRWGSWPLAFLPVLDGQVLRRHPADSLAEADVDVVAGWTKDEATFAFGLDDDVRNATESRVRTWIAEEFGSEADADGLRARPGDVMMNVFADEAFRAPLLDAVARRSASGRSSWTYRFDLASPAYGGRLGATHCLELPFTFGNTDRWSHAPMMEGIDPPTLRRMTEAMHGAWISFARTGNPNHLGLPQWDTYPAVMQFDAVARPVG